MSNLNLTVLRLNICMSLQECELFMDRTYNSPTSSSCLDAFER